MSKEPRIITELAELVEQATKEKSHYYVKSVCEKAILAIGCLIAEDKRMQKEKQSLEAQLKKAEEALSFYARVMSEADISRIESDAGDIAREYFRKKEK